MGLNARSFAIDRALLEIRLSQLGERSSREILAVMRDEAEQIANLARQYAPVDDHFLEQAIEVVEDRGGINTRTQVYVQVNPDAVDERGQSVLQYAALQHELLGPYGAGIWRLGPKSREKDGGTGRVGGKFLERAVNERKRTISYRIEKIARKVF